MEAFGCRLTNTKRWRQRPPTKAQGAKGSQSPTKAQAVLKYDESGAVSGELTKRPPRCLWMAGISESSLNCCLWCAPRGPNEKALLGQGNAASAAATGMPPGCLVLRSVSWVFPHDPAAPEHPALRRGLCVCPGVKDTPADRRQTVRDAATGHSVEPKRQQKFSALPTAQAVTQTGLLPGV